MPRRGHSRLLTAGLLTGAAIGLKLTFAIYAVAAVAALLVIGKNMRQRLLSVVWFGAGSLAGSALTLGYWAWTLNREFGNPVFPFYNAIFQSPYALPMNWEFALQLPATRMQLVFYPFYFIQNQALALEVPFQDLRLALVGALAALVVIAKGWRRLRGQVPAVNTGPNRAAACLLVFSGVAYIVWQGKFHILRYLCPVNLLAPVLIVFLLAGLLGWQRRLFLAATAACFLIVG